MPAALLAAPRAPIDMNLDEDTIHLVSIHTEVNTLLIFPADVTLILGHGLTKGQHPGKVYCQQAENAKLLVLRQLEKNSTVLMQIVMGGKAFVFRLSGSDRPASVIRFNSPGYAPPATEISLADFTKTKRTVSKKRLGELIRLTREAAFLKPRLPHEYEGFASRRVSFSSQIGAHLTAEITVLARFRAEDTLILFGRIRNTGQKTIRLPQSLRLKVGEKRSYRFSHFNITTGSLKPGQDTVFSAALAGDGEGRLLHLSLDNRFAIAPAN